MGGEKSRYEYPFGRYLGSPPPGGEKFSCTIISEGWVGSPPRRRGKGHRIVPNVEGLRITPAWAGKSVPHFQRVRLGKDHPRMGGEKYALAAARRCSRGSPPRGRGKDSFIVHCHACVGITPAWAGKSEIQQVYAILNGDHPRVGGEKMVLSPLISPLAWDHPRRAGKTGEHR